MANFYQIDEPPDLFSSFYLPLKERVKHKVKKRSIIVIGGPTGSGKSKLAIDIAKEICGEIISVDAMQVYRKMDIGTAKVSMEEMNGIPHHLIDVRDVREVFNVVDFYKMAHKALREILIRRHMPIVVGGSGFYMHVFLYGPPLGPPSNKEVREKLRRKMEEMGAEVLYERLQMLDPIYAKTITEKDKHKIIRALEIISLSHKKVSDFPKQHLESGNLNFNCFFIFLPREKLYEKLDLRCDEMIERGFIEEVEELEKIGIMENSSASQAIGYKQCLEFLKGKISREEFIFEFKKASRRYAKKQFTWFRKEKRFKWLNMDELGFEKAKEIILESIC